MGTCWKCARQVKLRLDGNVAVHNVKTRWKIKVGAMRCSGGGQPPDSHRIKLFKEAKDV